MDTYSDAEPHQPETKMIRKCYLKLQKKRHQAREDVADGVERGGGHCRPIEAIIVFCWSTVALVLEKPVNNLTIALQ